MFDFIVSLALQHSSIFLCGPLEKWISHPLSGQACVCLVCIVCWQDTEPTMQTEPEVIKEAIYCQNKK